MTSAHREALRHALDAHKRAILQARIDTGAVQACSRCGCDQELLTPGCVTCWGRHRNRKAVA